MRFAYHNSKVIIALSWKVICLFGFVQLDENAAKHQTVNNKYMKMNIKQNKQAKKSPSHPPSMFISNVPFFVCFSFIAGNKTYLLIPFLYFQYPIITLLRPKRPPYHFFLCKKLAPKAFSFIYNTSRSYLVPVSKFCTWTKGTPPKKLFFWFNAYNIFSRRNPRVSKLRSQDHIYKIIWITW